MAVYFKKNEGNLIKKNHIEVSEDNTIIVSTVECPLKISQVFTTQVYNNVITCKNKGVQEKYYTCPSFFGVTYDSNMFCVDCRY